MSGKTWLEGDKAKGLAAGFDRFPQKPGEQIAVWARRLSAAADQERVSIKSSTIETRIYEQRRLKKK
jgi:hypothetical protein